MKGLECKFFKGENGFLFIFDYLILVQWHIYSTEMDQGQEI